MPQNALAGRALSALTVVPDLRPTDRLAMLRPTAPDPLDQNVTLTADRLQFEMLANLTPAVLAALAGILTGKADRDALTGYVVPAQLPPYTFAGTQGNPLDHPLLRALLLAGGQNSVNRTYAQAQNDILDAALLPPKLYRLTNRPNGATTDILVQAVSTTAFGGNEAYSQDMSVADAPPLPVTYAFATDTATARVVTAPAVPLPYFQVTVAAAQGMAADPYDVFRVALYHVLRGAAGDVLLQGIPSRPPVTAGAGDTPGGFSPTGIWYDPVTGKYVLVKYDVTTDTVTPFGGGFTTETAGGNLVTQPSGITSNTIGEGADPTAVFVGNVIDVTGNGNKIGQNAGAGAQVGANSISGAGAANNSISGDGAENNSITGAHAVGNNLADCKNCSLQYCSGVAITNGNYLAFIGCTAAVNYLASTTPGPALFINDVLYTGGAAGSDPLKQSISDKGAANGYAPLDSSSVVPAVYLPSYVDDVEEYATFAAFPATGATGKIYLATNNLDGQWRWTGSAYRQFNSAIGTSDNVTEGSVNLYFTAARVRAAVLTGLSTAAATVVNATHTVLQALGFLQAQAQANAAGIAANAAAILTAQQRLPFTTRTANYTLTAADFGTVVRMDSPTPVTVTIPAGLGTGAGEHVEIAQAGAGTVTVVFGSGVTPAAHPAGANKVQGQHAAVTLHCRPTANVWNLAGAIV